MIPNSGNNPAPIAPALQTPQTQPSASAAVQAPSVPSPQDTTPAQAAVTAQPQRAQQPSLFRRILSGALAGMSAGLEGTTPQAIAETNARTQLVKEQTADAAQQRQFDAQVQPLTVENYKLRNSLAQAQIQSIPDQVERDRAQAAYDLARSHQISKLLNLMPDSQQEQALQGLDEFTRDSVEHGARFLSADVTRGFTPSQSGSYGAATTLLHRLLQQDTATKGGFSYLIGSYPGEGGKRQFGVIAIPDPSYDSGKLGQDTTITVDGKKITVPAGTSVNTVVRAEFDGLLNSIVQQHADAQKKTQQRIDAVKSNIASLRSEAAKAVTNPALQNKLNAQADALQQQLDQFLGLPTDSGASQSANVQVQIPGMPAGTIPRANLQQFMKDHPNAKVIQ